MVLKSREHHRFLWWRKFRELRGGFRDHQQRMDPYRLSSADHLAILFIHRKPPLKVTSPINHTVYIYIYFLNRPKVYHSIQRQREYALLRGPHCSPLHRPASSFCVTVIDMSSSLYPFSVAEQIFVVEKLQLPSGSTKTPSTTVEEDRVR